MKQTHQHKRTLPRPEHREPGEAQGLGKILGGILILLITGILVTEVLAGSTVLVGSTYWWLILVVVLLIGGVWAVKTGVEEVYHAIALHVKGKTISGVVVNCWAEEKNWDYYHYIAYRFDVAEDKNTFTGVMEISRFEHETLPIGTSITIRYLPANPEISKVVALKKRPRRPLTKSFSPSSLFENLWKIVGATVFASISGFFLISWLRQGEEIGIIVFFGGCSLLPCLLVIIASWLNLRHAKQLCQHGLMTTGTIIDLWAYVDENTDDYWVAYQFEAIMAHGQKKWIRKKEAVKSRWYSQVWFGTLVNVRYLPTHPTICHIEPVDTMTEHTDRHRSTHLVYSPTTSVMKDLQDTDVGSRLSKKT